jgi:hypothetical protein
VIDPDYDAWLQEKLTTGLAKELASGIIGHLLDQPLLEDAKRRTSPRQPLSVARLKRRARVLALSCPRCTARSGEPCVWRPQDIPRRPHEDSLHGARYQLASETAKRERALAVLAELDLDVVKSYVLSAQLIESLVEDRP